MERHRSNRVNQDAARPDREPVVDEETEASDRAAVTATSLALARRGPDGAAVQTYAEKICADSVDALAVAGGPGAALLVERWRPLIDDAAEKLAGTPAARPLVESALARVGELEAELRVGHARVCAEVRQKIEDVLDDADDAGAQVQTLYAQARGWLGKNLGPGDTELPAAVASKQSRIEKTANAKHDQVQKPDQEPGGETGPEAKKKPAVVTAQVKAMSFEDVVANAPKMADIPAVITLPKQLVDGLQKGWDESFPEGKSQEQVGILVKTKDGKCEWRAGPPGDSGSGQINYGDVGVDDTLLAAEHTHPYDESEGGHTGVSFSGGDLARLVMVPERIHVVKAGDVSFMVIKTAEFDDMMKGADDDKREEMFTKINECWTNAFADAEGGIVAASEAAVKVVCKKFHLGLYKGRDARMQKV